jgi:hypothetical protein
MERKDDVQLELVELGTASTETQGIPGPAFEVTGPDKQLGISHD